MRVGSSAVCRTVVRRFAPFHNSRSSTIAFRPNMAVRLGAFSSVCCSHAMHSAAFNTSVRRFHGGETQDYYATLGVKPDATQDEIKAAYKKLALEFHPDRNHEPGAEDKFKNISAAYNVVGHRDKRREYDMQRNAFGGGPRGGGGGPSSQGYAAPGFSSQAGGGYPGGYQQMSKEEADRLFREIFGGMRVDQIFRNLEDEMRRGNMRSPHGGLGHSVGQTFAPGQQVFRPFFSTTSESTKVYTDAFGNRMEEHTYVDPRGRRFTVRKQSSTDPNASTNQTPEDYDSSHASSRDGRVHLGKVSRSFEKPNTDFTENFFGVRSHGRNPFVGMALIVAWAVVLGTLLYCTLYFFLNHPFFSLAVIFLVMAGRRGRF